MTVLIKSWKEGYKFYSVWALAVLGAMPDLLNALTAAGLLTSEEMPEVAKWAIRAVAIFGIVSRFISQAKPQGLPPEVEPRL